MNKKWKRYTNIKSKEWLYSPFYTTFPNILNSKRDTVKVNSMFYFSIFLTLLFWIFCSEDEVQIIFLKNRFAKKISFSKEAKGLSKVSETISVRLLKSFPMTLGGSYSWLNRSICLTCWPGVAGRTLPHCKVRLLTSDCILEAPPLLPSRRSAPKSRWFFPTKVSRPSLWPTPSLIPPEPSGLCYSHAHCSQWQWFSFHQKHVLRVYPA